MAGLLAYLVVIVAATVLIDEYMRLHYLFRAWRAKAPALPLIRMSRPFGLPNLKRMILASKDDMGIESGLSIYKLVNRKTFLQQFSFDMEFHTKDPENVKAMLATQFNDFDLGKREETLGYFLGSGIFTLSGERWKHSRAMLRPQFSRQLVGQLESVDQHVAIMISIVKRKGRVNFQHLFHQLTMDTATEFLFGESTNTLQEENGVRNGVSASEFVSDYRMCLLYSLVRFQLGPLYWLVQPKSFRDAIARCRRYVDYFVESALEETKDEKNTEERYTFSYELAKVTRNPVVIRDQLFNILVAGHDTTANLLGYTVWYMGHYTHVWDKLRAAILELYPDSNTEITFENIKRCTYLTWVLNEVLRLHPIVPRNLRFAIRDTFLPRGGGPDESQPMFVPKGSAICYHTFGIHRDPEFWGEDAEAFNPERWENPMPAHWAYLPFNGGPRICLGQQFALTEASLTIIRLAQNFVSFDLDNPELLQPKNQAELTTQVSGGVWGTAVSPE